MYQRLLKRTILFVFTAFISLGGYSATYYVSSSGNDSNSGLSVSLAWKTLSKVNSTTLSPGDQVLFERGSMFYSSLTVKNSGASGSPITFGAYGSGANPVITGFTTVSSWTNVGSNIWESTSAVSSLSSCNMVAVNGVNTPMGRYPNSGYLTTNSHSGSTSITSNSLSGSWTGAEVVVMVNDWKINKSTVTGQSGTTLTYSPAMEYAPLDGFGFFVQNDARTLDAQNEWYYNPSTKKLRIYSSSQPTDVKVATVDAIITVQGSNLTFDNLEVAGSNKYGFYITSSNSNLVIQNSSVRFSGLVGIQGQAQCTSPRVTGCTISDSNSEGIYYLSSNPGAVITDNTFQNTGVYPGMKNNSGAYTAIRLSAPENTLVQYNRITNTGFNAIAWYNGSGTQVRNNFIDNFCSVIEDGGGIYSYYSQVNSIIDGNILLNGHSIGIYNDDESKNFKVTNNSVYNCGGHGILTKATYTTISGNTVFGCGTYQMLMYLPASSTTVTNSTVNNIFFCRTASQMAVEYDYPSGSIANIGNPDNNYYARPISEGSTIRVWITNGSAQNYTLSAWQSYSGKDQNSKKSPQAITDVNDLQFEYNATKTAKTISLSRPMIDVKGVKYSGSVTLQPFTSIVLMKDKNQS